MSKKLWLVSITLAAVGGLLGVSFEGTSGGEIGWFISCIGILGIIVGSIAYNLALKFDISQISEKPKEILQKVIKSLIVVAIVIVCGVILYDHVNERIFSMVGGGIILVSLGAIWKPKKTSESGQDNKPKDEQNNK